MNANLNIHFDTQMLRDFLRSLNAYRRSVFVGSEFFQTGKTIMVRDIEKKMLEVLDEHQGMAAITVMERTIGLNTAFIELNQDSLCGEANSLTLTVGDVLSVTAHAYDTYSIVIDGCVEEVVCVPF